MTARHGRGSTPKLPVSPLTTGGGSPGMGRTECVPPLSFVDRSLEGVNPLSEQFAPDEGTPIPQRAKMGGMG